MLHAARLFAVLLVAALAFFAGRDSVPPPEIVTRVDTVRPIEYRRTLESLQIENAGLKARLEGVERRVPERIIVVRDTVLVPDTVIRFVSVDSRGRLAVELLTGNGELRVPELHIGTDISNCDEGWQIQDGETVCDRARLGHLYVVPRLAREPMLGLAWTPGYRSAWQAGVGYSGRRWEGWVERRVPLW